MKRGTRVFLMVLHILAKYSWWLNMIIVMGMFVTFYVRLSKLALLFNIMHTLMLFSAYITPLKDTGQAEGSKEDARRTFWVFYPIEFSLCTMIEYFIPNDRIVFLFFWNYRIRSVKLVWISIKNSKCSKCLKHFFKWSLFKLREYRWNWDVIIAVVS